ncbi:hypothetical protein ABGB18_49250 [Nonomuraea sp. B12E4]|uniref:hypothetical protein n=1 Tax=Nonomuraea sp. B12E4 TaxID=3153564 RepID=UPI00325CF0C9
MSECLAVRGMVPQRIVPEQHDLRGLIHDRDPATRGVCQQDAHRALVAACEHVGLESRGAVPIRLGENALYRLASAPVVRIARSVDRLPDVQKEVAVARWLEAADFPGVRLCPDLPQAAIHEGRCRPPPPLKPGESSHFKAAIYALDLLLPIGDLGQQSASIQKE